MSACCQLDSAAGDRLSGADGKVRAAMTIASPPTGFRSGQRITARAALDERIDALARDGASDGLPRRDADTGGKEMAHPKGFEPLASAFGGGTSIPTIANARASF